MSLPAAIMHSTTAPPRKVSSVDEVWVAFCQGGDDLADLRLMAYRLRSAGLSSLAS